jgi:hypothetical protein
MAKKRLWATFSVLTLLVMLLLGCAARYLSEPPSEFYNYVNSVPTPNKSTLLAEDLSRWTSPQEVCTGFALRWLYGTNQPYDEVVAAYEQDLRNSREKVGKWHTLATPDLFIFIVSDVATINLRKSYDTDPVALLHFDEYTMREGQRMYTTLFVLDLEHRYGNCDPNPLWPEQWQGPE